MAWHLDVPEQDPEIIVIDEDNCNPIRTKLLGQADITFVHLSLLHASTMEHILRLLGRGRCRGVWLRLQPMIGDVARRQGGTRRQRQRLMATSLLIARLI